jgi:hypothetical protein
MPPSSSPPIVPPAPPPAAPNKSPKDDSTSSWSAACRSAGVEAGRKAKEDDDEDEVGRAGREPAFTARDDGDGAVEDGADGMATGDEREAAPAVVKGVITDPLLMTGVLSAEGAAWTAGNDEDEAAAAAACVAGVGLTGDAGGGDMRGDGAGEAAASPSRGVVSPPSAFSAGVLQTGG